MTDKITAGQREKWDRLADLDREIRQRFAMHENLARFVNILDAAYQAGAERGAAPAPTPETILKTKYVTSEEMLRLGLEQCIAEHDKVCVATCSCPHAAIHAARFLVKAYEAT